MCHSFYRKDTVHIFRNAAHLKNKLTKTWCHIIFATPIIFHKKPLRHLTAAYLLGAWPLALGPWHPAFATDDFAAPHTKIIPCAFRKRTLHAGHRDMVVRGRGCDQPLS